MNLEGQGIEIALYGIQGKTQRLMVLIRVMVGSKLYFERSFWLLFGARMEAVV